MTGYWARDPRAKVALDRLGRVADDLGRLKHHMDPCGYAAHLVGRISGEVELLDALWREPASVRYRRLIHVRVRPEEALEQALAEVDADATRLRSRLALQEQR